MVILQQATKKFPCLIIYDMESGLIYALSLINGGHSILRGENNKPLSLREWKEKHG